MHPAPRTHGTTLAAASLLLTLPLLGLAAIAPTAAAWGTLTHTYDEFSGAWNYVGALYPGYTYSGDAWVFCDYDPAGYVKSTPPCAIFSTYANTFTITANDASHEFVQYEVDVSSYNKVVTLQGFDAWGNNVASTSCSSAWATYTHCTLASSGGMRSVTVSGPYGYFVDTSVFTVRTPPTACFTHSESWLTTTVDGSCSSDVGGSVASWSWTWGDGSAPSSGATASHTYADEGTYTVTLTVTNAGGLSSSTSQAVTVTRTHPVACFTHAESGLSTSVDGSCSSVVGASIAAWAWTWGDGSSPASGRTASHAYASGGTYTVTLTVTDTAGFSSSTSQPVTVCQDFGVECAGVSVGGTGVSQGVPAQSTPEVPSEDVTTPPLMTPATCTVAVCTNPTTVPSQSVGPTPEIPAQSTPPIEVCDPTGTVCVIDGPRPLTPGVPPQGPFETPGATVPAICDEFAAACLGPMQVVGSQTLTTPGQAPIPLTPDATVAVSTTGFFAAVQPHLGEFQTIPETDVGLVKLCREPPSTVCQSAPVPPSWILAGSLTVEAKVGDTEVQHTLALP